MVNVESSAENSPAATIDATKPDEEPETTPVPEETKKEKRGRLISQKKLRLSLSCYCFIKTLFYTMT